MDRDFHEYFESGPRVNNAFRVIRTLYLLIKSRLKLLKLETAKLFNSVFYVISDYKKLLI